MTVKQSLQLSIVLHAVLLNMVIIEWVLFFQELSPISRIGFGAVSFSIALSVTAKITSFRRRRGFESGFTTSLLALSIMTLDWFFFESTAAPILTEFTVLVFALESILYALYFQIRTSHVVILALNVLLMSVLRLFPSIAIGVVEVSPQIELFFRWEALTLWVIGGAVMLYLFTQVKAIMKSKQDNTEALWYSDMFSLVSHNIRTPMATISNIAQILEIKGNMVVDSDDVKVSKDMIERLSESSEQATAIVDELLRKETMIRLDTDGEVTLNKFLTNWTKQHAGVLLKEIEFGRLKTLSGKEQIALSVALDVLYSNSMKHGANVITIESLEHGTISFHDNGSGMSQEDVNAFGTPFHSNSETGAGLGTYFAKEILSRSGNTLEPIYSEQGARIDISFKTSLQYSNELVLDF